MDIKFKVTGQKLMMLTKYNKFVSDAKDFMYLVFDLPREWLGYAVTAEFTQNGRIISKPLNTKNSIYLPSELSEGICLVSLRGESTASIVTTDSIALYIDKYVGSDGSGDNYITVELSTPTINITENGLITASVTQEEGYVLESSKQASLQLPVHDGGFVKPGKIDKIVTPSGVYTTGDLIVSGDANLDPSNIRKGSTIFDVQGTYEGYHGVELPELSDPGSAEDLVYGKEMIDGDGNVVTGKFELLSTEIAENAFLYAPNVGVREANGSKRIYFNTSIASRIGYEAGAPIQMEAVTANFGNAKPEDVIDGATFTSAEGLNVSGTLPFLPAGQRASIGLAKEASRIGYGQYPVVRATAPIRVRLAMEAESSAQVDIPFWILPGAEPNLLAENIRKGVSIFDVVGTFEGSGGGNSGVVLPAISNQGSAEDLLYGKQLIDADGKIVNGTMECITAENTSFILPSSNAVEYEDAYGKRIMMSMQLPRRLAFDTGSTVRMQSNLTNFGDAVASDVTKGKTFTSANGYMVTGTKEDTIVAVEQATPSISVDSYGKVTATATQEAGYVEAGTKTAEKQLNVATYAKYTPTKNDYYIPINNKYVIGNQIIKGDANLVPNNIKKGVSIFDVVGTYEGSSGATTTLKTKEGTFTSGSSNMSIITVDCGFAPAAVTIFVYNASQRRQNNMSFVNHTFGSTTVSMFHNYTDASSCAVYGILEFTETGFTISVDSKNSDGSANSYAFNREFSYYAIG